MDGTGEPGAGRPRDVGAATEGEGQAVPGSGADRLGGERVAPDVRPGL